MNISRTCEFVIFDGDRTLWRCLEDTDDNPIALSDEGHGSGRSSYRFTRECDDKSIILRDDDKRFKLFVETRKVLQQLTDAGVNISLVSYNHPEPVFSALEAFDIHEFFNHPVAAWTPRKDLMIEMVLASFANDRRIAADGTGDSADPIERSKVLLVDDGDRYAPDALRAGIRFFHLRDPERDLPKVVSLVMN